MPQPEKVYHGDNPLTSVTFLRGKVKKKLDDLTPTSAPGPDRLWPRVLCNLSDVLSEPLAIIYSKCLEEGVVPNDWKLAHITPIFKKGSKAAAGNYRPVSLTCVLCKVMESIIKDAVMEHLSSNNLIKSTQHGFMPRRSCLTNMLEYLEELTKLVDKGHSVDVVYLDFAKAFDKVPHLRLAQKCEGHGIQGKVLDWIVEWLAGRQQRVVLNGKLSG